MNFGSPPRKRESSPIRFLEDRSPNRPCRLHPILQEDHYQAIPSRISANPVSFDSSSRILLDKIKNYAQESHRTIIENSRLSKQNQILKDNQILSLDRLNKEIIFKDLQIEKLLGDMSVLKNHYERDIDRFVVENESLKKQLNALEKSKMLQATEIKQKYNRMADDDINFAKQVYIDDINKLMDSLESTKILLFQKQNQLRDLTVVSQGISKQYNSNLEYLISENNILRNKLMMLEMKKQNEIKQEEQRKELEKSRTNGIMTHCKQSNAYMEKEIARLANQLLEKNISIEGFTRQILKFEKNIEQKDKKHEARIKKLEQQKKKEIKQFEKLIAHMSKMHKDETDNLRKREIEVRERLNTQEEDNLNLKRQIQHVNSIIEKKEGENDQLKGTINRLHDDHSKDVEKLMTDSRKMKGSMRNLSERSIKGAGSNKAINIGQEEKPRNNLQVVIEENDQPKKVENFNDAESQGDGHMEYDSIESIIKQYQNRLVQLQNDKHLRLRLAQEEIDQLQRNLNIKQKQVLEILRKFTPLMQLKMDDKSIEEERQQKIKKHYKADLDILDVMLNKYQIAYLSDKTG